MQGAFQLRLHGFNIQKFAGSDGVKHLSFVHWPQWPGAQLARSYLYLLQRKWNFFLAQARSGSKSHQSPEEWTTRNCWESVDRQTKSRWNLSGHFVLISEMAWIQLSKVKQFQQVVPLIRTSLYLIGVLDVFKFFSKTIQYYIIGIQPRLSLDSQGSSKLNDLGGVTCVCETLGVTGNLLAFCIWGGHPSHPIGGWPKKRSMVGVVNVPAILCVFSDSNRNLIVTAIHLWRAPWILDLTCRLSNSCFKTRLQIELTVERQPERRLPWLISWNLVYSGLRFKPRFLLSSGGFSTYALSRVCETCEGNGPSYAGKSVASYMYLFEGCDSRVWIAQVELPTTTSGSTHQKNTNSGLYGSSNIRTLHRYCFKHRQFSWPFWRSKVVMKHVTKDVWTAHTRHPPTGIASWRSLSVRDWFWPMSNWRIWQWRTLDFPNNAVASYFGKRKKHKAKAPNKVSKATPTTNISINPTSIHSFMRSHIYI